jgi:hypothetical protein
MSHLLAADSRNSKVQNAVVPRGVPRSTWSLPNDARPQEGNRQARRRRQAEARRLQRKARQPQAKGAVLAPRATAAAAGASRSRVAIKRSTRTGQDGVSPMDSMAPTFEPIASSTTFGPLTDISMGWDGTVWGIDGQGAPHVYDAINDVWAQHGSGIDAAAVSYQPDCAAYIFMGSQVITVTPAMQANPPRPIGDLWPKLPDSFKLGVAGAAGLLGGSGGVMLFNAGRYVTTDNSVRPGMLAKLPGWPQTPNWADGLIDAVYSGGVTSQGKPVCILVRKGEAVNLDLLQMRVDYGPVPLDQLVNIQNMGLPASWASFDAGILAGSSPTTWMFKGTAAALPSDGSGPATLKYLGNLVSAWPATWHPVLRHAPNGRDGNLWSVLPSAQGSYIVHHDGTAWNVRAEQADHVGVGQDNAVMLASAQKLWTFNGTGFDPVSQAQNLIQVSLGNANLVFARDTNNNVYSFDPASGALTQDSDVSAVIHIATTNDGSLWHAKSNDADMHREIVASGAAPEAISVNQGVVTSVEKVAATGFGAAHCLAQDNKGNPQVYRYNSPYVFKTAMPYDTGSWSLCPTFIEQGAGQLFFVDSVLLDDNPFQGQSRIVTIDAHTGVEVAATAWMPTPLGYGQPVFDPALDLVYVGTSPLADGVDPTPGQLLALDAHTLAVKWSFTASAGIDGMPALNRTRLCVSDRSGKLYMFDTAAAASNPSAVSPKWVVAATTNTAATHRIATPVFVGNVEDLIYSAVWDCNHDDTTGNWTFQGTWVSYLVPDGSPNDRYALHTVTGSYEPNALLTTPAHGKLNIATASAPQSSQAIFYNCCDAVIGVGAGPTPRTFQLPAGDWVSTGLTYDAKANAIWFGSYNGTLYSLDTNLAVANHTPFTPAQQNDIFTTPVIYNDTQGGATVLFGTDEQQDLLGFDPANGNVAAVPTGVTRIYTLSRTVTNGVIYVGGSNGRRVTTPGQYPQVFGIRVDQLPQAERAFIIESQLLQDPDPSATGTGNIPANGPLPANPIPPSVARYQTHLTVVDDQKTPRPNETVKIWADVANTVITVGGQQYAVGPDDAAYATVTTGIDGCVVIVSDAPNINTSALRVWASFMDPFERILVYPDHEWHGRVASSYADASADPNRPDPTKPNLSTAYRYNGTQLFSDDEKSQNAPTNVANAVAQMNAGLKPGGNSTASMAGALNTVHSANPQASYIAYTDLGGMHYGPNNARARRTATVYAPFGFTLSKPAGGPHTFTPMSHSEARNAIDALTGTPWDPNNPPSAAASATAATFVVGAPENIFTDFWNWLVGAITKAVEAIESVVVSVADDIVVGIKYIVGKAEYVFKAIIKVVEDVANAIGSFFMQLAKLIEDVIEALSVLFHFGEIIWTHNWLKAQFQTLFTTDLPNILTTTVQPILQKAVSAVDVAPYFANFEKMLGLSNQVNSVKGSGSTPHSTYATTGSSCSVQASWGTQHLKSGLSSGASGATLMGQRAGAGQALPIGSQGGDDPLETFLADFWTSVTSGKDADAFNKLKSDLSNAFNAQSPRDFFDSLLSALIDTVALLVETALCIAGNLATGICDYAGELVAWIVSALNYSIDIPPITQLYKLLFNEDLTLLNVIMLVAAIPVTIVFRLFEGQYPSQKLSPITASGLMQAEALGSSAAPVAAQRACFITNGILSMAYGLLSAAGDNPKGDALPWLGAATAGIAALMTAFSAPWIYSDSDAITDVDWEPWGFGTAFVLVNIGAVKKPPPSDESAAALNSAEGAFSLFWDVFQFVEDGKTDPATDLGFASDLFTAVPSLINPVKLVPDYGPVIASTTDIVCYLCNAFLCFIRAAALQSPQPQEGESPPLAAISRNNRSGREEAV